MKKFFACILTVAMVMMLSSCAIITKGSEEPPKDTTYKPTSDSISYSGSSNSVNKPTENTRETTDTTELTEPTVETTKPTEGTEGGGNNGNGNGGGGGIFDSCPHNIWDENTCLDCGKTCDHNGTEVWKSNATTHTKVLSCCGMVLEAPELHEIEDGVCGICNYGN